jgi:hypothetical protein
MAGKADQNKEHTINLASPSEGFRCSMHFNRFCIVKLDDIRVIQFALVHGIRTLRVFTCSICAEDLRMNQERIMAYVARLTETPEKPQPWELYEDSGSVPEVKIMHAARTNNRAELVLLSFSLQTAFEVDKEGKKRDVPVEPIARLCSTLTLQMALFLELFAGLEAAGDLAT